MSGSDSTKVQVSCSLQTRTWDSITSEGAIIFSTTGSTTRSSLVGAILVAALILVPVAVPPARAVTDITDPSLPHTADSVIPDPYGWWDPFNVSDDLLGWAMACWHSNDVRFGSCFPHWVQIDFGMPRTVQQLNLMIYSEYPYSDLRLRDFWFEGSNDGVTYTPLHEGLLQYANRHELQSFYFSNTTGYRYYRLYGLNNWGGSVPEQMVVEEWEMFETTIGACCLPSSVCFVGSREECEASAGTYLDDGIPCDPNPCESTPVKNTTWGEVKSLFR